MNFLDKVKFKVYKKLQKSIRGIPLEAEEEEFKKSKDPAMTDYLELYKNYVWVYSSVFAISSACAMIPLKFYKKVSKNKKIPLDESSEVGALFFRPNPWMSSFDLWEWTFGFLELTGNCFWEVTYSEKNGRKRPVLLSPLRSDKVKIIPDPKRKIRGYEYEVNGKKIQFEPDEIIHFKYFNPTSEYWGLTALSPLQQSVIIDLYTMLYNKRFFQKGAKMSGILETDRSLTDNTIQRLRKQWEETYAGASKSHKTLILEEGLKYKQIEASKGDMEFSEGRKLSRQEVISGFGVNPAKVGIFDLTTFASAFEMKRAFYEDTILPKLKKVQAHLNELVFPKFYTNVFCEFDISGVDALKENLDIKTRIWERVLNCGVMTINEIRAQEGLPAVPWGNEPHFSTQRKQKYDARTGGPDRGLPENPRTEEE